jgi:spermidine/putrescine transport system substrate-binding protein
MDAQTPPRAPTVWSRRRFLRNAGGAVGVLSLGQLLAACASDEARATFSDAPAGLVNFANWPYYLDRDGTPTNGPGPFRPSLEAFTDETGILVNYREVIPDAETFFKMIEPRLAANQPTGWDIIVITNGSTLTKMIQLDYLEELPSDRRPNFDRFAADEVKDPIYDPGNAHTMAWQSGITGIAYNPQFTGRPITSMEDLFSDEFAGKVGMFGDNVDLPNLALVAIGVDPAESTEADWRAAAEKLRKQRADGVLRGYYKQNYIRALANGELAVSMAWSGDVFQQNIEGDPDGMQFVIPDEGAVLWTDTMCVPKNAEHPADAITLMDHVFTPETAATIAAWVNYITPVPQAQDVLLARADETDDPDDAASLTAVAESPLVFLSDADRGRLRTYRELRTPDELAVWAEIFGEFYL